METTPGPHWRLVLGRVPRAQPDPRGSRRWGELAGLVHALGDVTPRQVDGGAAVLRSRDLGRGSTPANCARYRRGRTVPDIDAGWPRHRTSPALGSGQSSSRCSRAPWRSCPLGDVTPPGGRRRRCAAVARLGTWIDARQLRPISTRPNCARYRPGAPRHRTSPALGSGQSSSRRSRTHRGSRRRTGPRGARSPARRRHAARRTAAAGVPRSRDWDRRPPPNCARYRREATRHRTSLAVGSGQSSSRQPERQRSVARLIPGTVRPPAERWPS